MNSKQIVIDACIARSAGESDAPVSTSCREFLQAFVSSTKHLLVFSKEIKDEWMKHESKYSQKIRFILARQGRIKNVNNCCDLDLRQSIQTSTADSSRINPMLKDVILIEAAIITDNIVVSRDERIRNHYLTVVNKIDRLKMIIWVNPIDRNDDPINWLLAGCIENTGKTLEERCRKAGIQ